MAARTAGRRTVHLVRHAESNWNVRTAGEHVGAHPHIVDVDSELSPRGVEQAAALRGSPPLAPPPTLILSSPLRRALRTAVALSEANGGAPIRAEPLATEWLENSCDVGSPGSVLADEFPAVEGLAQLGAR